MTQNHKKGLFQPKKLPTSVGELYAMFYNLLFRFLAWTTVVVIIPFTMWWFHTVSVVQKNTEEIHRLDSVKLNRYNHDWLLYYFTYHVGTEHQELMESIGMKYKTPYYYDWLLEHKRDVDRIRGN